ncbi:hypothetical protein HDU97_006505 [Phlyctochytrium planicorne]|nr:hypothetical protein HDU97_006505 [Phlyctochytrium planicorne]
MLRVASVAGRVKDLEKDLTFPKGQFFSTFELIACLQRMSFEEACPNFESNLHELLEVSQSHGILSSAHDDSNSTYSFHHYLIYQGIYQSLLHKRREDIHGLYADYYQSLYEHSAENSHLSTLLHHLLKLSGHEQRKKKFARQAFKSFALFNRHVEARMYYDIIVELEAALPESKSTLQQSYENRLMGIVEREAGNFQNAQQHFLKAFFVLGFDFMQKGLQFTLKKIKCLTKIMRLANKSNKYRCIQSLFMLLRLFPHGFARADVLAYAQMLKRRKVPPLHGETKKLFPAIVDTCREIRSLCISSLSVAMTYGSAIIDVSFLQFIIYFAQSTLTDESNELEMAMASTSMGIIFSILKMYRHAKLMYEESSQLYRVAEIDGGLTINGEPPKNMYISQQDLGLRLYPSSLRLYVLSFNCIVVNFIKGDFANCIPACHLFLELGGKAYSASIPTTHLMRLKSIVAATMLGDIAASADDILLSLQNGYQDFLKLIEGKEMQMCLANQYLSLGRRDEALKIYKENSSGLETYLKSSNIANAWRILLFAIIRSRIEVNKVWNSSNSDDVAKEVDSMIVTIGIIKQSVQLLKPGQIPTAFPLFLLLSPTLLDFAILQNTHFVPSSNLPRLSEGIRGILEVSNVIIKGAGAYTVNTSYIREVCRIVKALVDPNGIKCLLKAHGSLSTLATKLAREKFFSLTNPLVYRLVARVAFLEVLIKSPNYKVSPCIERMTLFKTAFDGLVGYGMLEDASLIEKVL